MNWKSNRSGVEKLQKKKKSTKNNKEIAEISNHFFHKVFMKKNVFDWSQKLQ